jgi:4-amino-4-deoxy-L-arabinose transferase-like glycosyltransferase
MVSAVQSAPAQHRNLSRWILLTVILLAFALRLYRLDFQSLRGDEAASATYASLTPPEILEISRVADPHPPLFYLVLHAWERLVGPSAFAVRLWVAFAGVLTVPSLYALARLLVGPRWAVLAAFLLAINSFHVWHSQDVRSYTWFVLLGLWLALFLWRSLQPGRWFDWLAYALSLIVLFYLHYYSLFLLAFQGLFVLWWAFQRRSLSMLLRWLGTVLAAFLAFLPWLATSWQFIARFTGDFDPALPQTVLWRGLQAFSGGLTVEPPRFVAAMIGVIILAGLGSWWLWRQQFSAALFLSLYWLLPFLGIMILTLRGQAFTERYLIAALPPYLIFVATGLGWLLAQRNRWGHLIALVGGLLMLGMNGQALYRYQFDPALAKSPEWQQVFDYIDHAQQPAADVLLYNYPEAAVTYYLDTNRTDVSDTTALPIFLMPPERNPTFTAVDDWLTNLLTDYARVWFVPINGSGWDDAGAVDIWLTRYADEIDAAAFHWIGTKLYLTPAEIERTMHVQSAAFANGIALRGFRVFATIPQGQPTEPLVVSKDDPLELSLYWTSSGPTAQPLTVFTQLIDPTGFRRGGQDNQPVWGRYPTTDWQPGEAIVDQYRLQLDPDAPTGLYQLWVGWYDPQTGERVLLLDPDGQPIADHLILDIEILVEEP